MFSPHPNPLPKGEGIARCGLHLWEEYLPGAVFSPSPLWGEGRGEGEAYFIRAI